MKLSSKRIKKAVCVLCSIEESSIIDIYAIDNNEYLIIFNDYNTWKPVKLSLKLEYMKLLSTQES